MKNIKNKNSKNKGGALADDMYNGAAAYGTFTALINLIFSVFITIIMISIGIFLLINPGKHSESTQGIIITSNCSSKTVKSNKGGTLTQTTQNNCSPNVKYTVNGKEYDKTYESMSVFTFYSSGQNVTILYNPENPEDSVIKTFFNRKTIAWILIGLSILILVGSAINYYIVKTYKFAAAGEGVANVASKFRSSSETDNWSTYEPNSNN